MSIAVFKVFVIEQMFGLSYFSSHPKRCNIWKSKMCIKITDLENQLTRTTSKHNDAAENLNAIIHALSEILSCVGIRKDYRTVTKDDFDALSEEVECNFQIEMKHISIKPTVDNWDDYISINKLHDIQIEKHMRMKIINKAAITVRKLQEHLIDTVFLIVNLNNKILAIKQEITDLHERHNFQIHQVPKIKFARFIGSVSPATEKVSCDNLSLYDPLASKNLYTQVIYEEDEDDEEDKDDINAIFKFESFSPEKVNNLTKLSPHYGK